MRKIFVLIVLLFASQTYADTAQIAMPSASEVLATMSNGNIDANIKMWKKIYHIMALEGQNPQAAQAASRVASLLSAQNDLEGATLYYKIALDADPGNQQGTEGIKQIQDLHTRGFK